MAYETTSKQASKQASKGVAMRIEALEKRVAALENIEFGGVPLGQMDSFDVLDENGKPQKGLEGGAL